MRAMASLEPPGGKGTSSVTGLVGQAWASAVVVAAALSSSAVNSFFMACLRFVLCDDLLRAELGDQRAE